MVQTNIDRWIVRLDGYHMIIEHRTREKHQNPDSLSKKTEFYEQLNEKQANQAEIKDSFSFWTKRLMISCHSPDGLTRRAPHTRTPRTFR